ncbi:uncharacterized protein EV422DRAFT_291013 [Fimicolochytrium jonesii]|uniref:uncharacterized protein n=1 Tax=Fimicolochytrium jonesii TaxID=1396493 RepID=UPI0022FE9284|nr:uncharacterized protein EV422DRAFT_291013 [Fimicolochytrium jonesii]KAI8816391.1 hypothetical protein EV422DRAFT_291013 [Fimicolochytrium jonesii]
MHLPLELITKIFHYAERKSRLQMLLACRTWHSMFVKPLYSRISFHHPSQFDVLFATLCKHSERLQWIKEFILIAATATVTEDWTQPMCMKLVSILTIAHPECVELTFNGVTTVYIPEVCHYPSRYICGFERGRLSFFCLDSQDPLSPEVLALAENLRWIYAPETTTLVHMTAMWTTVLEGSLSCRHYIWNIVHCTFEAYQWAQIPTLTRVCLRMRHKRVTIHITDLPESILTLEVSFGHFMLKLPTWYVWNPARVIRYAPGRRRYRTEARWTEELAGYHGGGTLELMVRENTGAEHMQGVEIFKNEAVASGKFDSVRCTPIMEEWEATFADVQSL